MTMMSRVLATLLLGSLLFMSIVGFMATFEPLDGSAQIMWRIMYAVVGALSLFALVKCWRYRRFP